MFESRLKDVTERIAFYFFWPRDLGQGRPRRDSLRKQEPSRACGGLRPHGGAAARGPAWRPGCGTLRDRRGGPERGRRLQPAPPHAACSCADGDDDAGKVSVSKHEGARSAVPPARPPRRHLPPPRAGPARPLCTRPAPPRARARPPRTHAIPGHAPIPRARAHAPHTLVPPTHAHVPRCSRSTASLGEGSAAGGSPEPRGSSQVCSLPTQAFVILAERRPAGTLTCGTVTTGLAGSPATALPRRQDAEGSPTGAAQGAGEQGPGGRLPGPGRCPAPVPRAPGAQAQRPVPLPPQGPHCQDEPAPSESHSSGHDAEPAASGSAARTGKRARGVGHSCGPRGRPTQPGAGERETRVQGGGQAEASQGE